MRYSKKKFLVHARVFFKTAPHSHFLITRHQIPFRCRTPQSSFFYPVAKSFLSAPAEYFLMSTLPQSFPSLRRKISFLCHTPKVLCYVAPISTFLFRNPENLSYVAPLTFFPSRPSKVPYYLALLKY